MRNLPTITSPNKLALSSPMRPFGQIDEQNLFGVHDLAEVKRRVLLRDDRAHKVVGRELVKLAGDVGTVVLKPLLAGRLLGDLLPKRFTIGFYIQQVLRFETQHH